MLRGPPVREQVNMAFAPKSIESCREVFRAPAGRCPQLQSVVSHTSVCCPGPGELEGGEGGGEAGREG